MYIYIYINIVLRLGRICRLQFSICCCCWLLCLSRFAVATAKHTEVEPLEKHGNHNILAYLLFCVSGGQVRILF